MEEVVSFISPPTLPVSLESVIFTNLEHNSIRKNVTALEVDLFKKLNNIKGI